MTAHSHPVELEALDISRYRRGNTGIDYVTTLDSGTPGPHVMLSAVVHGNELCGAHALDYLLREGVRPARGRLTLGFMNVAAYARFDPANPVVSRYVDEDFNRVWSAAVLDGPRDSVELRRAREVRPLVDTVDLLLDIHFHAACDAAVDARRPARQGQTTRPRSRDPGSCRLRRGPRRRHPAARLRGIRRTGQRSQCPARRMRTALGVRDGSSRHRGRAPVPGMHGGRGAGMGGSPAAAGHPGRAADHRGERTGDHPLRLLPVRRGVPGDGGDFRRGHRHRLGTESVQFARPAPTVSSSCRRAVCAVENRRYGSAATSTEQASRWRSACNPGSIRPTILFASREGKKR